MKKIIFVFCMFVVWYGCEHDEPDGRWRDIIKFSTTELFFNAQGGSSVITSKGNWWWILSYMYIDDINYDLCEDSEYVFVSEREPYDGSVEPIKKIESPWFTITKENKQTLSFSIKQNDTGKARKFELMVEAGNYFSSITVTQAAE